MSASLGGGAAVVPIELGRIVGGMDLSFLAADKGVVYKRLFRRSSSLGVCILSFADSSDLW
jgi:hypothetical protein